MYSRRGRLAFRAAVLGSALLLTVVACGGGGGGSGDPNGAATLTYLTHFNQVPGSAIEKKVVNAFEKAHPKVKVRIMALQSGTEFTKFQTLASAGSPPDVYLADSSIMSALLSHKVLAPVDYKAVGVRDKNALESQYISGVFDGYTVDGMTYGLPEEYSNYGSWVNVKAFKDAGLDVPTTWDQVCQDGSKLLRKKNGKVVQEEVALPTNLSVSQVYFLDAVAREFGSPLFNASGTKSNLTSKATVNAFTMLQNLVYKCNAAVPSLNSSTQGADRLVFGSGQAAMMFTGGAWYLGSLKQQYKAVAPPISAAYPYPTTGGAEPASESYGYAWVVPKAGKNQTLAWKLAKALADAGNEDFTQMGLFDGRKSVGSSKAATSQPFWTSVWQPALAHSSYAVSLANGSQIDDIIGNAFDDIILHHGNVKSALQNADKQVQPLLNQGG